MFYMPLHSEDRTQRLICSTNKQLVVIYIRSHGFRNVSFALQWCKKCVRAHRTRRCYCGKERQAARGKVKTNHSESKSRNSLYILWEREKNTQLVTTLSVRARSLARPPVCLCIVSFISYTYLSRMAINAVYGSFIVG